MPVVPMTKAAARGRPLVRSVESRGCLHPALGRRGERAVKHRRRLLSVCVLRAGGGHTEAL